MAQRVNKSETAMTGVSLGEKGAWTAALGGIPTGMVTGNLGVPAGLTATAALGSLSGHALAKVLYSPRGTQLLLRGLKTPAGSTLYTVPLMAEIMKLAGEQPSDRQ